MNRYILRRILIALPVLLGITIITFTLTELAPGDAVSAMIASRRYEGLAPPSDPTALRKLMGLDQPAYVRYLRWIGGILQGDLGGSITPPFTPISQKISIKLGPTLELTTTALIFSVILGIGLGVLSAIYQYSWFDYISTALVFFGVSVPGFFAALAAIFIFGVKLHWFPASGYSTLTGHFGFWDGLFDHLKYLVMPAVVLGIESTAGIMRYTRSSMLETIRLDYVNVARSKGLRERTVILRHALRNALLPVITIIGLRLPGLFGGAIVIEAVFGWPGLGSLYLEGVSARDYPLIMSMTLISAVLIVLSNMLTDIAYGIADPRIRYE
ncbi:MAG: ABC transporter permease [Chloroflexi bacterium]|nr:ABC transporter permease [Chloroflexota bacterium]